jgi:hypothetical protein
MLRFKKFLLENASNPNIDLNLVGRRIYTGLPPGLETHATQIYNAITTRPINPQFSAFDSSVQGAWRDPRMGIIGANENYWDHMKAGMRKLEDVKAASPSYALGDTFKRYWSVADVHDPKVIEKWGAAIPELRDRMSGVADQFKTAFTFKVPQHADMAGKHVDSIVAHQYGLPDTPLTRSMDATTRQWAKDSGLRLLDRRGLDSGVDVRGRGSFSELMAQEIAKQNWDAKHGSGKSGTRSLSQIGQDILGSEVARVGKSAGKTALKALPIVGTAASLAAMTQRAQAGDYTGAGLEAASEVADYIPGIGTAASLGIQAYLADRDMPEEEKKKQQSNLARQNLRSIGQTIR